MGLCTACLSSVHRAFLSKCRSHLGVCKCTLEVEALEYTQWGYVGVM